MQSGEATGATVSLCGLVPGRLLSNSVLGAENLGPAEALQRSAEKVVSAGFCREDFSMAWLPQG